MTELTRTRLAGMIDHTLLTPEATADEVAATVAEAARLGAYSVCVSPSQLPIEVPEGLKVACVTGFPSGAHEASVKAFEAEKAVANGADEVDMVVNLGLVKAHNFAAVAEEITTVRAAILGATLKVIIESAVLDDDKIRHVCQAAKSAGADFVKTSTGFHPAGGATVHAVEIMRETVGESLGVKASGGIRDTDTALAMVRAGATRLGLSRSADILAGLE